MPDTNLYLALGAGVVVVLVVLIFTMRGGDAPKAQKKGKKENSANAGADHTARESKPKKAQEAEAKPKKAENKSAEATPKAPKAKTEAAKPAAKAEAKATPPKAESAKPAAKAEAKPAAKAEAKPAAKAEAKPAAKADAKAAAKGKPDAKTAAKAEPKAEPKAHKAEPKAEPAKPVNDDDGWEQVPTKKPRAQKAAATTAAPAATAAATPAPAPTAAAAAPAKPAAKAAAKPAEKEEAEEVAESSPAIQRPSFAAPSAAAKAAARASVGQWPTASRKMEAAHNDKGWHVQAPAWKGSEHSAQSGANWHIERPPMPEGTYDHVNTALEYFNANVAPITLNQNSTLGRVAVAESQRGALIGPKGANLKRIRAVSGVKDIKMPEKAGAAADGEGTSTAARPVDQAIVVEGKAEQIREAHRLMLLLIEGAHYRAQGGAQKKQKVNIQKLQRMAQGNGETDRAAQLQAEVDEVGEAVRQADQLASDAYFRFHNDQRTESNAQLVLAGQQATEAVSRLEEYLSRPQKSFNSARNVTVLGLDQVSAPAITTFLEERRLKHTTDTEGAITITRDV